MLISEVVGPLQPVVRTVKPRDTIADTVDILSEYSIGAVVVTTDGRAINGIISERDVVRYLAHEQEGTLRVHVEDLMTRTVATCQLEDDVDVVLATMIDGHFRHMPIVDADNALYGIASLADLSTARVADLQSQNRLLRELTDK